MFVYGVLRLCAILRRRGFVRDKTSACYSLQAAAASCLLSLQSAAFVIAACTVGCSADASMQ